MKSIEEAEEEVSSSKKQKEDEACFQDWFVLSVASAVSFGSFLLVAMPPNGPGWPLFPLVILGGAAGVATLWGACLTAKCLLATTTTTTTNSSFSKQGRHCLLFMASCWLLVLTYVNFLNNFDNNAFCVTLNLFGWLSFGIAYHKLLAIHLDDSDNNHDNDDNRNQERTMRWGKFTFVALVNCIYVAWYLGDWTTTLVSLATLLWIVWVILYQGRLEESFPPILALALLFVAMYWLQITAFPTWYDLVVVGFIMANAYYAMRLTTTNLAQEEDQWTLRRSKRFTAWSCLTLASVVSLSGLVALVTFAGRSLGSNHRSTSTSGSSSPSPFICGVSATMLVFLLLHGLAAMRFYWQHEKPQIITENRLIHASAGISITVFWVVTCAMNDLAITRGQLGLAGPVALYLGVAAILFLSVHMVLYFVFPSVMLLFNQRQRAWVPVALLAVLVALDSAINLASLEDCDMAGDKNDDDDDPRCFPLLISRTFGIVLAGLAGTIVHLERTLSRPVYRILAGATWVGFLIGTLWLNMSPFLNSDEIGLPTLRLIGYPLGIVRSSQCLAQILFDEKHSRFFAGETDVYLEQDAACVEISRDLEETEIEDACSKCF